MNRNWCAGGGDEVLWHVLTDDPKRIQCKNCGRKLLIRSVSLKRRGVVDLVPAHRAANRTNREAA